MPERLTPEREAYTRRVCLAAANEHHIGALFGAQEVRELLAELDAQRAIIAERGATIRQLWEAARPFAQLWEFWGKRYRELGAPNPPGDHTPIVVNGGGFSYPDCPTLGDCRKLAALLPPEPGPTAAKE